MVPVDLHRRRQPQPQPHQQQQQQQQQRPWATWMTWQDVYPRLEHPANAAERRTLSILSTFRLFPGVGLGAREQGMLLPLDGRAMAITGKRRGIGFEAQSVPRWPREGAWQPATDLPAVQQPMADDGAMAVDEPSVPRFAAASTAAPLVEGQLQQRLVVYQASRRVSSEQLAEREVADNEQEDLGRLVVANTLANRSAVVGDSALTYCEQLEQAIRASAVLDWVLATARDAAELAYKRETQEAALWDRAERQRGEALAAEQRDSGTAAQRDSRTATERDSGTADQRDSGMAAQQCSGTAVQRDSAMADQWQQGDVDSSGTAMETVEDAATAVQLEAEQRAMGAAAERTGQHGMGASRGRGPRSKRSRQARYQRVQSWAHSK